MTEFRIFARLTIAVWALLLIACAAKAVREWNAYQERGIATWYGPGFDGKTTANGERFNMHLFTAAHRSLPLGTLVEVKSLATGRVVRVRINDRGPYVGDRVIDLSYAAARELGMLKKGTHKVEITVRSPLFSRPSSRVVARVK